MNVDYSLHNLIKRGQNLTLLVCIIIEFTVEMREVCNFLNSCHDTLKLGRLMLKSSWCHCKVPPMKLLTTLGAQKQNEWRKMPTHKLFGQRLKNRSSPTLSSLRIIFDDQSGS